MPGFALPRMSSRAVAASFDAILIATDHDKFDYDLIKKEARLIVDTRGKYRSTLKKIIKS